MDDSDCITPFVENNWEFFKGIFVGYYCGGAIGTQLLTGLRAQSRLMRACIDAPSHDTVPMELATRAVKEGDMSYCAVLREKYDLNNGSLLMTAARQGNARACAQIREWSRTFQVLDRSRAMVYAAKKGHIGVIRELAQWCADSRDLWINEMFRVVPRAALDELASIARDLGWHYAMDEFARLLYMIKHGEVTEIDEESPEIIAKFASDRHARRDVMASAVRAGNVALCVKMRDSGVEPFYTVLYKSSRSGSVVLRQLIDDWRSYDVKDQPASIFWTVTSMQREKTMQYRAYNAGKSGDPGMCEYELPPDFEHAVAEVIPHMIHGAIARSHDKLYCELVERLIARTSHTDELRDFEKYQITAAWHFLFSSTAKLGNSRVLEWLISKSRFRLPIDHLVAASAASSGDIRTWRVARANFKCQSSRDARCAIVGALRGGNEAILRDAYSINSKHKVRATLDELIDVLRAQPEHPRHLMHSLEYARDCRCRMCSTITTLMERE